MFIINANDSRMEEVEIFGIPALFTPHKVERTTLYPGMYCYEIQVTRIDKAHPMALVNEAKTDFYGTVMTPIPVTIPNTKYRAIGLSDFVTGIGAGYYTPAEFEDKYMNPGDKD